ncbi:site-specific recombinase XerD [Herminiimonas fonticola]|uniref:Site-specific recombinase XerD n=2 Tax=Herminiimonas fonticola TaxID=303380 RepID=A0A4R6G3L2_9BURK|nr:Phage integrase family [Herminiimonas fonticola]TDN88996.1 site-specific recombinase XerD [Herminiimonas fonticola]
MGETVANITERKGKYHVRVYRKEGAVCKSFILRKDALAWARQVESDIQSGRWRPPSANNAMTLKEALNRYSADVTVAKKGAAQETYVIQAIIRDRLSASPLLSIKPVDIASLRDRWLATLAPATVRRRLAILSHCFEIAHKEWAIEVTNPLLSIRKPTVSNGRNRRLLPGELEAVLKTSKSAELSPIAHLAVETAMRLSEIIQLQWCDVSLAKRFISLKDTKNGTGRVVPLSPEAVAILQRLQPRSEGALFRSNGAVISKAWRRALTGAYSLYKRQCVESGSALLAGYLSDLHFHDLRHEATSRLFERGVFGTMEVASITGHKTLQMLSRYTHLNATLLAERLAHSSNQSAVVADAVRKGDV